MRGRRISRSTPPGRRAPIQIAQPIVKVSGITTRTMGFYHNIVEGIPRQASSGDHHSGHQRCAKSSDRVTSGQKPLECAASMHPSNPGRKAGVCKTVSKSTKRVAHNQYGKRRMDSKYHKCHNMTNWCQNSNPTLAPSHVDSRTHECCD